MWLFYHDRFCWSLPKHHLDYLNVDDAEKIFQKLELFNSHEAKIAKQFAWKSVFPADGSGSKFFWPVSSHIFGSQIRSGRVRHLRVWKISPRNPKVFNFFTFRSKKFHLVRSKNIQVGPLFAAGHKYARMGSGPILTNMLQKYKDFCSILVKIPLPFRHEFWSQRIHAILFGAKTKERARVVTVTHRLPPQIVSFKPE